MNDNFGIQGGSSPSYSSEQMDTKMAMVPTLKSRLDRSVEDCKSRLADAVRAREILNAHPELEELLNIMQKGRF